jgi:hypothetical protein
MRPDPRQDHERDASGRIIYLGDVRRRRSRRTAPDRHYLAAVVLLGVVAWAVWLCVFLTLAPARLLTFLAFFVPLGLALAATGTVVAYAIDVRRTQVPSLLRAGRRGSLVAAVLVTNLAVTAAHRWTPFVAIGSIALAVSADIVVARRSELG